MGHHDRHGRMARADNDLRRRPSDGFRTADQGRFIRVVQQAVSGLPDELREHLRGVELDVRDVPDVDGPDVDIDGDLRLARLQLPGPDTPRGRLIILRRPLELRAQRRSDLHDDIALAVRHATQDALGRPRDDP
ncbi:MAG TPA: hypothetical protein VMM13_00160 [Euzebya sp.]|nr:hypothetical protein [Euzebya sp.]